MKTCKVKGCKKVVKSRGICMGHYSSARRSGNLEETADPKSSKSGSKTPKVKEPPVYAEQEPITQRAPDVSGTQKDKVYIVTSAQCNTPVNDDFFTTLEAIAEDVEAELIVLPVKYFPHGTPEVLGYTARVAPYLLETPRALSGYIALYPNMPCIPTAAYPLTGLGSTSGDTSIIIGHPKTALDSIPRMDGATAKFLYTSGSCTVPNYSTSRAGARGEEHHTISALIVEVPVDSPAFVRQLHWDETRGVVSDLEREYTPGGGVGVSKVAAVILGDSHVAQICRRNSRAIWGPEGLISVLKPGLQVFHDIFDMLARNPHEVGCPRAMYNTWLLGLGNVQQEVEDAARFLAGVAAFSKVVVVGSNHDDMLDRWLNTADFRKDPLNAKFFLKLSLMMLEERDSTALPLAVRDALGGSMEGINFLKVDQSHEVEGVELGIHGHIGMKGSRGSPRQFGRLGFKSVTGHTHTPTIVNGCYTVGVSGKLKMPYMKGPNNTAHAHCVLFKGGKRQMIILSPDHKVRMEK